MSGVGNHSEYRQARTSPERNGHTSDSQRTEQTQQQQRQAFPPVKSTLSNKALPAPPSLPARPSASLRLDPAAPRAPVASTSASRRPANFRPRSRSRSRSRSPDRHRERSYSPSLSRRYAGRRSPSPPPAPLDRRVPIESRDKESRLRELDQELERYRRGEGPSLPSLPRQDSRYGSVNPRGDQAHEDRYRRGRELRNERHTESNRGPSLPPRSRSPGPRIYRPRSPSPIRRRRSPSPRSYQDRRDRSPLTPPFTPSDPKSNGGKTAGLSLHERIFGTVNKGLTEEKSLAREDQEYRDVPSRIRPQERDRTEVDRHYRERSEPALHSPPPKRRKVETEYPSRTIQPVEIKPVVPTGPRATRPFTSIPTGPRSSFVQPPRTNYHPDSRFGSAAVVGQASAYARNGSTTHAVDDMSGRGRGGLGGKNGSGGGGRGKSRSASRGRAAGRAVKDLGMTRQQELLPALSGPMRTREQIMQEFGQGGRLDVKQAWVENPKSPVANWFGAGKGDGSVPYEMEKGLLDGKVIYRVSIVLDAYRGLAGVGDSSKQPEAEKLAALSALYQLVATRMINNPIRSSAGGGGGNNVSGAATPQESSETVKLPDGTIVTYEKARLFVEYYCNRFRFGKPDLKYDSITEGRSKRGLKISKWEAIMNIGGRNIGVGKATNKKLATKLCYLDVTQYLESCDPDLWIHFVTQGGGSMGEDVRKAPHLTFTCSDNLVELVRELCSEARNSNLFKKAPTPNTVAPPMVIAHQPFSMPPSTALKSRSDKLLDQLQDYEADKTPSVKKMRELRASLPIYPYRQEILRIIDENEVTVLTANTGSGKSTQTPQYILDEYIQAGKGADCRILVTQPRRLAALALADRVSEERNSKIGREVGYHVRFDAKLPEDNGSITFMTIGILLKRLQSALSHQNEITWFDSVSHIVLDEVHERDLDTDLLLVILKRMLKTRKEAGLHVPKILLMSATINADLFRNYFKNDRGQKAPLVDVPGKTYPVTRSYLDGFIGDLQQRSNAAGSWVFQDKLVRQYLDADNAIGGYQSGNEKEVDLPFPLIALTIAHVVQKHRSGHVLVFLPGLEEMKRVSKVLLNEDRRSPLPVNFTDSTKYSVHTLHSTTPVAEQREVFVAAPNGVQRIILATNIAETSVTIPGTTVVVDSGRAKLKIYDPSRHVSALVTSWAGSANLDQRAGRAGRERPGDYYAVFGSNRLKSLRAHQVVEMLRLDLSEVVMHVKALNIGMVEDVLQQAIEPPAEERVEAALSMLRLLGALDSRQNVLPLGKVLLQVPCDARLGKLLLFGTVFKCLSPALTIAAILGSRDPFLAPPHLREQSNEIKNSWSPKHFRSDALCVEAAFNAWWEMQSRGDYFNANKFLNDNLLSKPTMLGIQQIREQLYDALVHANALTLMTGKRYVKRRRLLIVPEDFDVNADSLPLKAALISIGSIPNFAIRTNPKMCRTAQDSNCMIHVGSVNNKKREDASPMAGDGDFVGEKRLYTFQEKVASMQGSASAPKQLRNVTRIDPLTYLLFGASHMRVLENGLEADDWLPITGNLDALDDIQRLRIVIDSCFLRVWEGLDHLNRVRTPALRRKAPTESRAASLTPDDDNDEEEEEEQAEFGMFDEELDKMGRGSARQTEKESEGALSPDELIELSYLSSDVVRILDAFAEERAPDLSRATTRPSTPF